MEICPILCPILIGGFQNENEINEVEDVTCLGDIFLIMNKNENGDN